MNIVNKLTLRHLKENKGRTVITTFGIIVSVAMITAVFVAIASFMNMTGDVAKIADGDFAAKMYNVNQSAVDELYNDDRIETVGLCNESYKEFRIDNGKSDRLSTGTIAACDSNYLKMFVQSSYDGILPTNNNEIAVQSDFIEKNELDWKTGDIVYIPCGTRTYLNGENVTGTYLPNETFKGNEIKKYRITAILYQNSPTSKYPILTAFDGKDYTVAAFQLAKLDKDSLKVTNEIIKRAKVSDDDRNLNTDLMYSHYAIGENSLIMAVLPIILIILIIIMVASVVLIYNAFAMSLSEKVRYLGMLSSVGATKKQKRLSIYFEGFILALFGIPLGMVAGVTGIGITLKLIGDKIVSTNMVSGVTSDNIQMRVLLPPVFIILIIVLSVITIIISSSIPAFKASKITTIDAIRQTNEVKVKAKALRSPKIIKKIFGYEGEIAYKNLKRNGRKGRVITASIALSIILFLSCNSFCELFMQTIDISNSPYQVGCSFNDEQKDSAIKEISSIDKIDDMYCALNFFYGLNQNNELRKDYSQFYQDKYLTSTYKNSFDKHLNFEINLLDDDMFNELCQKNKVDKNKYYNGKDFNLLLMNNITHSKYGKAVYNDNIIGTQFKDMYDTDYNIKYTITDFVKYSDCKACNLNTKGTVSLYMPYSQYVKACSALGKKDGISYYLAIETKDHEYVAEKLGKISDEGKYSNMNYVDILSQFQTLETVAFVIQVFVYGFVTLISLITVFNIINTISSGISSRKKEFAMLKSVGITPKGFNRMIMLESAFYGMKAVIFGIPLSVLIAYGMYSSIYNMEFPFTINAPLYLTVILVVFAVVGATMIYSVKKVQQNNIIDTLKEDIN